MSTIEDKLNQRLKEMDEQGAVLHRDLHKLEGCLIQMRSEREALALLIQNHRDEQDEARAQE